VHGARDGLLDVEKLSDQELEVLQQQCERLRKGVMRIPRHDKSRRGMAVVRNSGVQEVD